MLKLLKPIWKEQSSRVIFSPSTALKMPKEHCHFKNSFQRLTITIVAQIGTSLNIQIYYK